MAISAHFLNVCRQILLSFILIGEKVYNSDMNYLYCRILVEGVLLLKTTGTRIRAGLGPVLSLGTKNNFELTFFVHLIWKWYVLVGLGTYWYVEVVRVADV